MAPISVNDTNCTPTLIYDEDWVGTGGGGIQVVNAGVKGHAPTIAVSLAGAQLAGANQAQIIGGKLYVPPPVTLTETTFAATAGNGIQVLSGGTNGHEPSISVVLAGTQAGVPNAATFVSGRLYVPQSAFNLVTALSNLSIGATAIAGTTQVLGSDAEWHTLPLSGSSFDLSTVPTTDIDSTNPLLFLQNKTSGYEFTAIAAPTHPSSEKYSAVGLQFSTDGWGDAEPVGWWYMRERMPIKTVSATYSTVPTKDGLLLADTSAGSFDVILTTPGPADSNVFVVNKITTDIDAVVVRPGSLASLIDGQTSYSIDTPHNEVRFYFDGLNWYSSRSTATTADNSNVFGVLVNGLRDKYKWPFASTSIWNTPIGSNAVYQTAGIVFGSTLANANGAVVYGYPTRFGVDEDVIVMHPEAPALPVYYNNAQWSAVLSRCTIDGGLIQTVYVPSTYLLTHTIGNVPNNSFAGVMPDGATIQQNQPFQRCYGANGTTYVTWPDTSIYGSGEYGAHGGSGLSALGGTIRRGEFTVAKAGGRIRHALKINMAAEVYWNYARGPIWPADRVDGYASALNYGGSLSYLAPGALLALHPTFSVSSLTTLAAQIIAYALQDFGGYCTDDTDYNGVAINVEQGPDGKVTDEFFSLFGFTLDQDPGHAAAVVNANFTNDIQTIFTSLYVVTNNGPLNIGGGGTPRTALAPAIGN